MEDDRRYPGRPLLGVGGIIIDKQRVLLVERGTQPLKGFWSVPGGLVEAGEHLSEAVRREVREETGLHIEPVSVVDIFERIMRDDRGQPEYHYVLVDYLCRITGGVLGAASDASRVRWVPRAELPSIAVTEGTVEVILKAFEQS